MKTTILQELLAEDGVRLPEGGGAEKSIKCFSPHHEDSSPSMSVNVAKGLYRCHGCGIKGNAYQYLTDIRGWEPQRAMQRLEESGATREQTSTFVQRQAEHEASHAGRPKSVKEPYPRLGDGSECVDESDYTNGEGDLVFRVCRYEQKSTKPKKRKTFLPFTKQPEPGGWWVCSPTHEQLPDAVRITKYPIYRLQQLNEVLKVTQSRPDSAKRQIWLTEGEKCAKAVAACKNPKGQSPPVVSLYGGSKHPVENHDLSPLYGQRILLLADSDANGRSYMRKLGKELSKQNAEVRYLLPPGKSGDDVADALAKGGWDGLLDWVEHAGGVKTHEEVFKDEPSQTAPIEGDAMRDTPFFRVLGFGEGDTIIIQNKITHKLHTIRTSALIAEGNLLTFAPLVYWQAMCANGQITQRSRTVWADSIIRAAEKGGEINMLNKQMWRRGAVKDSCGKILYNVGDGILEADDSGLLVRKRGLGTDAESSDIYLPGPTIRLSDKPEVEKWMADFYRAVMSYRWEDPNHGRAFLGWIVTSLVGGALPWRPMLWLNAPGGTGKTFLLEKVFKPIFGETVTDMANATEAGIANMASDSSLPCYLDEFEPEKSKQERNENILGLVRVATSGDAARIRATSSGGVTITRPRFSLFLSSVNRPTLQSALETRFFFLRLSRRPVPNWPAVRDAILSAAEPEKCLAIRTRIIRSTKIVVDLACAVEDRMIKDGYNTREAQQMSALSAGAWLMSGRAEKGWLVDRVASQPEEDKFAPMSALFASLLRMPSGDYLTLAETLMKGYFSPGGNFYTDTDVGPPDMAIYRDSSQRVGCRFRDKETLWIAPTWPGLHRQLERTAYAQIDLKEYIARLPGAKKLVNKSGNPIRMRSGGIVKAVVAIPKQTLEAMGFFGTWDE